MRHNFKEPETEESCGLSGLRNAIIHRLKKDISEKTLRIHCETTKDGTTDKALIQGCQYYGFKVKEYRGVSFDVFKRKVSKSLREQKSLLISTEHYNHWILAVCRRGKRIKIVDGDYKKYKEKSIVQYVTMRQLADTSFGYDKFKDKKYFYFIEIE